MSTAPDNAWRRKGRKPFGVIGLFLSVYFITRLLGLDALPIFLDEAVHLQWAERLYSEGRILRPVGSGRLLAVAAYGLALPFEDRLWAARIVSSLAGAITLVFTMLLSDRLFSRRAAVVAGALYVLSPFALTYDRLALSDGFLSACLTALMFAVGRLADRPDDTSRRLAVAALLALSVLAKVSAPLFFLSLPLAVAPLAPDRRSALKAMVLAGVLGLCGASPMLWFFAGNSGEIAAQHVVDSAIAGATVAATLLDMRQWVVAYFTVPALFAAGFSLLLLRDGRALWLAGSLALPFALFALFSQPWSARYVLPTLPPLLILIAGGIDGLASRLRGEALAAALSTALASVAFVPFDLSLLFEPARAPFPPDDRSQLVTGWPSGFGVREIADRLKAEARGGPVLAYVDSGGTRTLSTSLAVLLAQHPSIHLVEGDFESAAFRASMGGARSGEREFAILSPRASGFDFRLQAEGLALTRIEAYARPGGEWAGTLFKVVPRTESQP